MSIAHVTVMSTEEAEQRYAKLVRSIDDLEAFRARGERYLLEVDDAARFDELRDLEFLIGRE